MNATEAAKLEKDGLDVIHDIEKYAQTGFASIPQADIDRMKWYGLYVQRPKSDGYFMLRVKIIGGRLTAVQARVLANIANQYGRGIADFSTRHSVQFHWLKIEDLPKVLGQIKAVGLTTTEAAGDCPRNVVGSPLSGVDPRELFDSRPIIEGLNAFFEGNREFSNLPRKFKISVTTNPAFNPNQEVNDLAFYPAVKEIDGQEVPGFHIKVGGGLSAQPRQAEVVNVFVVPNQVVPVAAAVAAIFRDHGYREKRNHARLKFLLADWGIAKFTEALLEKTGPLPQRGTDCKAHPGGYTFFGVHPQKQEGLNYVGLSVPLGRLSGQELKDLADLAEHYGDGTLNTTHTQDVLILNIPDGRVADLLKEPILKRITPNPKNLTGQAVVCTGKEFCPFAAAETKNSFKKILAALEEQNLFEESIQIHVSGCLHSCAQPQLAEIGLQGVVIQEPDKTVQEGFEFYVGGKITQFGTKLEGRVLATQVQTALSSLIRFIQDHKEKGEDVAQLVQRLGIEPFQAVLNSYVA